MDGKLKLDMGENAIRSFALKLAPAPSKLAKPESKAVALTCNVDGFSKDGQSQDGVFGAYSIPAELVPASLECDGVSFNLGQSETNNVLRCEQLQPCVSSGGRR